MRLCRSTRTVIKAWQALGCIPSDTGRLVPDQEKPECLTSISRGQGRLVDSKTGATIRITEMTLRLHPAVVRTMNGRDRTILVTRYYYPEPLDVHFVQTKKGPLFLKQQVLDELHYQFSLASVIGQVLCQKCEGIPGYPCPDCHGEGVVEAGIWMNC